MIIFHWKETILIAKVSKTTNIYFKKRKSIELGKISKSNYHVYNDLQRQSEKSVKRDPKEHQILKEYHSNSNKTLKNVKRKESHFYRQSSHGENNKYEFTDYINKLKQHNPLDKSGKKYQEILHEPDKIFSKNEEKNNEKPTIKIKKNTDNLFTINREEKQEVEEKSDTLKRVNSFIYSDSTSLNYSIPTYYEKDKSTSDDEILITENIPMKKQSSEINEKKKYFFSLWRKGAQLIYKLKKLNEYKNEMMIRKLLKKWREEVKRKNSIRKMFIMWSRVLWKNHKLKLKADNYYKNHFGRFIVKMQEYLKRNRKTRNIELQRLEKFRIYQVGVSIRKMRDQLKICRNLKRIFQKYKMNRSREIKREFTRKWVEFKNEAKNTKKICKNVSKYYKYKLFKKSFDKWKVLLKIKQNKAEINYLINRSRLKRAVQRIRDHKTIKQQYKEMRQKSSKHYICTKKLEYLNRFRFLIHFKKINKEKNESIYFYYSTVIKRKCFLNWMILKDSKHTKNEILMVFKELRSKRNKEKVFSRWKTMTNERIKLKKILIFAKMKSRIKLLLKVNVRFRNRSYIVGGK